MSIQKKATQVVSIPKNEAGYNTRKAASLTPEQTNKLVYTLGIPVKVFVTCLCPNVKSVDGGENEIDCNLCNGSGFIDRNPIETLAVVTQNQLRPHHYEEGIYDGSKCHMTFLTGIEIHYFYLVEIKDFIRPYYQRLKRSKSGTDVLNYNAKKINLLISKDGLEYYADTDFTINADGNIKWNTDRGPAEGTIYSINYEAPMRYRAVAAENMARFAKKHTKSKEIEISKLNERWVMQLDYIVKRKDYAGNELNRNLIEGKSGNNPHGY